MKIALAQLNLTLGDLAGNAAKIVGAAHDALQAGATLLVTPELAICGYPPEDLLLREDFYRYCDEAVERVAREAPGITIVIGHPRAFGGRRYNAASVLRGGQVIARYHKRNLPNYTVFDEQRYFDADTAPCVFEHEGVRFGINICEDVWGPQGRAHGEPRPFLHGEHAVASDSGPAPAPLATPSASIYMASLPSRAEMRLVVKPGASLTSIEVLPIALDHWRALATVCELVGDIDEERIGRAHRLSSGGIQNAARSGSYECLSVFHQSHSRAPFFHS